MSKKNKIIIGLVAIAAVLFCVIQFGVIPANQNKQAEYAEKQTDALTHDISAIEDFKSPYIGNANNVSNLFYALPLNQITMKFQVNSDECSLTVNYLDTVWNIGEEKVHRDLVYNSVAAMAAIDNLTAITYEFSGDTYSFERKEMEDVFGSPLSDLLKKEIWNEKVQSKLSSSDFVSQFFSAKLKNLTAMYETQEFLEGFVNNNYATKFIRYMGTPIDMETANFEETLVMGNNASNTASSPNGKRFRVLIRGDEQKSFMIDDEEKKYSVNDMAGVAHIQYYDFNYAESGTENLNSTECVFDTYNGKQLIGGDTSAFSLTIYLRADDHAIYALKTVRDTSTETILIKDMRMTVDESELECPDNYKEVDTDTFNQSLF